MLWAAPPVVPAKYTKWLIRKIIFWLAQMLHTPLSKIFGMCCIAAKGEHHEP
jgi:hypothetical protein